MKRFFIMVFSVFAGVAAYGAAVYVSQFIGLTYKNLLIFWCPVFEEGVKIGMAIVFGRLIRASKRDVVISAGVIALSFALIESYEYSHDYAAAGLRTFSEVWMARMSTTWWIHIGSSMMGAYNAPFFIIGVLSHSTFNASVLYKNALVFNVLPMATFILGALRMPRK